MFNRYTVEGIVQDIEAGITVDVVADSADTVFSQVMDYVMEEDVDVDTAHGVLTFLGSSRVKVLHWRDRATSTAEVLVLPFGMDVPRGTGAEIVRY